jgi:PilZ domain
MTERRMARRYDLSLPVNVRLPINREPGTHNGQTRDISTRGVYFMMEKDLAPGTEVDFTLTLPAEITRGSSGRNRALRYYPRRGVTDLGLFSAVRTMLSVCFCSLWLFSQSRNRASGCAPLRCAPGHFTPFSRIRLISVAFFT